MTAVALVQFMLLVIGLAYLITQAEITMYPRMWLASKSRLLRAALYCPMCVSFWLGAGLGLAFSFHSLWPVSMLVAGVAAVAVAHVWSSFTGGNPAYQLEQGEHDNAPKA